MTLSQYAIASGSNVALASLNNIENQIGQQNRKVTGGKLYPVGVRSGVPDFFPVRTELASGRIRGDGFVTVVWELTLVTYGARYLLNTYLSNMAAVSNAVTINTRNHPAANYVRANAYIVLPSATDGSLVYVRQGVFRVRLVFTRVQVI